jgi:hypothetical protein
VLSDESAVVGSDPGDAGLALGIGDFLEDFPEGVVPPELDGGIGVPHKGDEHGEFFLEVELVGTDGGPGRLGAEEGGEGREVLGEGDDVAGLVAGGGGKAGWHQVPFLRGFGFLRRRSVGPGSVGDSERIR